MPTSTNSIFQFKRASVSIAGDYYGVMFDDGLDTEDEPYFLIQRQFESPDGGVCYFESHQEILIGHFKVHSAVLSEEKLRISYGKAPRKEVEIHFALGDANYSNLASALKEMIPEITTLK